MICRENALRVEFAQLQDRAFDLKYFAKARVRRHKFGGRAEMSAVLKHAHERSGRVEVFDDAFVVARFRPAMLEPGDFARDAVAPLEVLNEIVSEGADVARLARAAACRCRSGGASRDQTRVGTA